MAGGSKKNSAVESTWKILIIDDDEEDYFLAREMLKEAQGRRIELEWAATYARGRSALFSGHYDAVLVDYDLGAHTGIELIREATTSGYAAPLILFTGRGGYEVDVEAMKAGATLYLAKGEANPLLLERSIRYAIELKSREHTLRQREAQLRVSEAHLRESEARFRDLANNITQLAWMADESGAIFWYNQRWYDYTGSTFKEMQGWGWQAVHHPDTVDKVVEKFRAHVSRGEVWEDTFPLRGKDGQYRWFLSRAVPIKDESGAVVRWFGTNTDVTEQRGLQQQVEQERFRLEAVLQSLPVGVWIADREGRITGKNEQADKIWAGISFIINSTGAYQAWQPNGNELLALEDYPMAKVLRTGAPVQAVELDIRRSDGSKGAVLVSAAPILDEEGRLVGAVAVNLDITERRQAQAALQESEQKFQAIFQNAPYPTILVRVADGHIVDANPAWLELFGYRIEEVIEHTSLELGIIFDAAERMRWYAILRQQGHLRNFEMTFQTRSGQQLLLLNNAVTLELNGERYLLSTTENITERKQVEQALRASEQREKESAERFKAILENSLDAPYRRDLQTDRYDYMSPVVEQVLGFSVQEMNTLSTAEVLARVHPEDLPALEKALEQAEQQGKGMLEYRFKHKDGRYRWLADHITVTRDASGRPRYRTGNLRDISESKQAEETLRQSEASLHASEAQLRESERRFRVTLASAPISVYTTDCDLRLTWIHDFHPDFQPENVLGLRLDELNPGETGAALIAIQQSVINTGQGQHGEVETWQDGQHSFYRYYIDPIRDAAGEVTGLACAGFDITERKQAEDAIVQSRTRLEAALASMTDAVFISDAAGNFIALNDAFATFHRLKDKAECPRTFTEYPRILDKFLPDGTLVPLDMWAVPRALRGEVATNTEYSLRRKDTGETWVGSYSFAPIRDTNGVIVGSVVVARDITDQKQAEQALARYAQELERSNQSLQDFAFVASHDLQEPLRKISMFGDSLRRHSAGSLDETANEYLKRMLNAAGRMQAMINGLLDLSRVNTRGKDFAPVDLNQVVEEVISDLEAQLLAVDGQVRFETLPTLEADNLQIRQLFQNLISNAIKFHKPGVPPEVRITAALTELNKPSPTAVIQVTDNGIGFDQQYAERIFQPFQRLHGRSVYEGTGLGLAICQKIVERHHGQHHRHQPVGCRHHLYDQAAGKAESVTSISEPFLKVSLAVFTVN